MEFEKKISQFLNIPYILTVGSCTDALIISLKALEIKPGDEVIVPALSFYSTAGAVAWVGAKPVFADIEEKSLNIDSDKIENAITPRTKAIIPVHLNGRMADMEKIRQIANSKGLSVIEDAAQAFGSTYQGKPIGHFADLACVSFNPQKLLRGYGDGGAVITRNSGLSQKISKLKMYGSTYRGLGQRHEILGIASRLNPLNAAVLLGNLEHFNPVLERRRKNYGLYSRHLQGIGDLILPENSDLENHNGYRFAVRTQKRNELLNFLNKNGVDARIHYPVPLPFLECFGYLNYKKGDFPVAEKVAQEILILPTESGLGEKDIMRNAELVKEFFK